MTVNNQGEEGRALVMPAGACARPKDRRSNNIRAKGILAVPWINPVQSFLTNSIKRKAVTRCFDL